HMGGVDLLDSIIARYRIAMRSKKWYLELFFHFMDVTMVNAWLLYRKKKENTMSLADFRREIVVSLCMQGSNICTPTTRGRKRNISESPSIQPYMPPTDVWKDEIGHFAIVTNLRERCKLCGLKSSMQCTKCRKYSKITYMYI
ncbi:piggyBac transposable element-derived protein 3-like, partial [Aphis craccivora]